MRNYIPTYFIIILLAAPAICKAQKMVTNPIVEKVTLNTDRTLYISGEQVLFSASLTFDNRSSSDLSQILYVDIISPDGKSISGGKFKIENLSTNGCVTIPEETITGVYYVRAYTKYMRNFGPESFSYNAIKIVNPLRNDVLEGNDFMEIQSTQLYTGISDTFTLSTDKIEYL